MLYEVITALKCESHILAEGYVVSGSDLIREITHIASETCQFRRKGSEVSLMREEAVVAPIIRDRMLNR